MVRNSAREPSSADSNGPNDRRGSRGWGPFTGGQLTAITLGIVIAIAFPVGAFAVTGSNIFVTDAVSGTHATVNGAGQVSTALAPPAKSFTRNVGGNYIAGGPVGTLLSATGTASIVMSITLQVNVVDVTPNTNTDFEMYTITGGTCVSPVGQPVSISNTRWFVTGTLELTFPAGLAIRAGHRLCARGAQFTGSEVQVDALINGYVVPNTECTPAGSTCN